MAKVKNDLVPKDDIQSNVGVPALKSMLATQAIRKQLKSLLGERAGHFMMAIIQVVEGTPQLQQAEPQSIINAAIALSKSPLKTTIVIPSLVSITLLSFFFSISRLVLSPFCNVANMFPSFFSRDSSVFFVTLLQL